MARILRGPPDASPVEPATDRGRILPESCAAVVVGAARAATARGLAVHDRRYLSIGMIAATLLAVLAGAPNGSESSAHSRGCTLPSPYFGSGWEVRSATLRLTRTGTWSGPAGVLTATETDVMTALRHRIRYRYPPLDLTEGCSSNWALALTFNSDDGAFTRQGTEEETGQWQDSAATPSTGSCKSGRVVKNGIHGEPFEVVLGSAADGFSVRFEQKATHVAIIARVQPPPGLDCASPFSVTAPARFSYPSRFSFVASSPLSVSTRLLEKDRGFSLKFTGSSTHQQRWGAAPNGAEQFRVAWSGELGFVPTGCTENSSTSPVTRRRCYPG